MNLAEIASCIAALVSVIALWKHTFDKRFDKIDDQFKEVREEFKLVRGDIKEIREDISDIRERLAGIEMSTIFLQVNPVPPSRSEIAKKMWDKRKSKQIQRVEE